ncbi:MAG: hypothetical protein JXB49_13995 [Bacteroidales bacterium]|nr:hypothetical protein [Bacteroidales bacterium]
MTSIEIKVGSKDFDFGQTILTLNSEGQIKAINLIEKEMFEFKHQADKSQFERLYKLLSSGELAAIKHRKGVPDEVKYVFSITDMDQTRKVEIWDNDLDQFKTLKAFMGELRQLIFKESKNKILL